MRPHSLRPGTAPDTTDRLIATLAADIRSITPASAAPLRDALLGGSLVSVALFFGCVGLRGDIGAALGTAAFWVKLAYTGLTGCLAWTVLRDRGRPGAVEATPWRAALPSASLAAVVIVETALAAALPGGWVSASRSRCLLLVLALALPILAALLVALRGQAPVRVPQAGALAGLVAGAAAATIYALGCGETSPVFVLVWYTLAMTLPTLIGMLVAPTVLRW